MTNSEKLVVVTELLQEQLRLVHVLAVFTVQPLEMISLQTTRNKIQTAENPFD